MSVGRVSHQAAQQSGVPALSLHITTSFELQTSSETDPIPKPYSTVTGMLKPTFEVEQRVQSPEDTESPASSPIAVRCLFYLCPTTPHRSLSTMGELDLLSHKGYRHIPIESFATTPGSRHVLCRVPRPTHRHPPHGGLGGSSSEFTTLRLGRSR